jgi:hypothetical protein
VGPLHHQQAHANKPFRLLPQVAGLVKLWLGSVSGELEHRLTRPATSAEVGPQGLLGVPRGVSCTFAAPFDCLLRVLYFLYRGGSICATLRVMPSPVWCVVIMTGWTQMSMDANACLMVPLER